MPAKKKKSSRPAKRAAKKVTYQSRYHRERDQFYSDHPNAKWLIALLIIAIAVWVGLTYQDYKKRQYQALQQVESVLGESYEFLE